ncbi:hypothetical protein [Jannaschia pohangensis]|uniref:FG-GAP repeat-containing protein n=1 Tax=Jannaschia pohangensis TaxID=390807 RepID=A0A1I3R0P6_9RHOB|nr:hypothetical protein [Jannaschia pohangensis]SFJ38856.1 hypothetical protein SAMN04488095_2713 [Jannaschia pohangensis]
MRMRLALCLALLASPVAAQQSNAARYLVAEELAAACEDRGGQFESGIFETDFDGDGQLDLMLHHEGIVCNGVPGRSLFCGAQACTLKIWLRRGDLLKLADEALLASVTVDSATPPVVRGYQHGGQELAFRWTGTGFEVR